MASLEDFDLGHLGAVIAGWIIVCLVQGGLDIVIMEIVDPGGGDFCGVRRGGVLDLEIVWEFETLLFRFISKPWKSNAGVSWTLAKYERPGEFGCSFLLLSTTFLKADYDLGTESVRSAMYI